MKNLYITIAVLGAVGLCIYLATQLNLLSLDNPATQTGAVDFAGKTLKVK